MIKVKSIHSITFCLICVCFVTVFNYVDAVLKVPLSCPVYDNGDAIQLTWYTTMDRYDDFKKEHDIPILEDEQVYNGILQVPFDSLGVIAMQNLNGLGFSWVEDDAICTQLRSVLDGAPDYETFRETYTPLFVKVNDNRYMAIHRHISGNFPAKLDLMLHVFDTDFNLLGYTTGVDKTRE